MPQSFNSRDASHARIYGSWRNLPAWQCLSLAARCALIEIFLDYRPPGNGREGNNGRLQFSVRRIAQALNIGKDTASLALTELEKLGWIVPQKLGAFAKRNAPTEYALTSYPNDATGAPASRAFEYAEPSRLASKVRRTRVGLQGHASLSRGTPQSAYRDSGQGKGGPLQISDALKTSIVVKALDNKPRAGRKRARGRDTQV